MQAFTPFSGGRVGICPQNVVQRLIRHMREAMGVARAHVVLRPVFGSESNPIRPSIGVISVPKAEIFWRHLLDCAGGWANIFCRK